MDWSKPMQRTYEFWLVDTATWGDQKLLDTVTSATITFDGTADTKGNATFECDSPLGECYIRTYMLCTQGGETARQCIGTFMVQTPSTSFDGKKVTVSLEAYTPLLELADAMPEIGYSAPASDKVLERAAKICMANCRAPIISASSSASSILCGEFVANTDDTWLSFVTDLVARAGYTPMVDERGRVFFKPSADAYSMAPSYTFTDDNSSILLADVTDDRDLYGIPNVVEVVYSNGDASYMARVVNDDKDSPVSTVSRGREVVFRDTSPSLSSTPSEAEAQAYAKNLLREKSMLEHTITFSHAYVPNLTIGDCVRLDYRAFGLNARAVIRTQNIECETAGTVTETAVYAERMWRK